ncbi:hypothetical protein CsatB_001850 [Cannabis sativa]
MAYALTFLDVDAADSATDERRTKLNVKCALYIDGTPFGPPTIQGLRRFKRER